MNSPHSLLYSVIALLLLSSIVSLVFVSIQNHRAVKRYFKAIEAGEVPAGTMDYSYDPEDFEEISFFEKAPVATPANNKEKTEGNTIGS